MPRVITITIPDHQNVNEVDGVLDEFQSELGHVCGDDEWTDRTEQRSEEYGGFPTAGFRSNADWLWC